MRRRRGVPGVVAVRELVAETAVSGRISWSADGRLLAVPHDDGSVRIWDVSAGKVVRVLRTSAEDAVLATSFHPHGPILATACADGTAAIWDVRTGERRRMLRGHRAAVHGLDWSPDGRVLATASVDTTIRLWPRGGKGRPRVIEGTSAHEAVKLSAKWDPHSPRLAAASYDAWVFDVQGGDQQQLRTGEGLYDVAWIDTPAGQLIAGASAKKVVHLWDAVSGRIVGRLEGHTADVRSIATSPDYSVLATAGGDGTIRFWRCTDWTLLATITGASPYGLSFSPIGSLLASVRGPVPRGTVIDIWEVDLAVLTDQARISAVRYATAKVVLVGDSGVGKTGLGWRLAHGKFKEHPSTHGQQFWVLDALRTNRSDGAQCEAVLWDLAGQPDYRLIHALFIDDADVALILFDATRPDDPLRGVEYWLKQLGNSLGTAEMRRRPTILIAGRADRGTSRLTVEELNSYCDQRNIQAYIATSAATGEGIDALLTTVKTIIPWDDKPATVTTTTFKRIKDRVLAIKESRRRRKVVLTLPELRTRLLRPPGRLSFSNEELATAVTHLATHGYVTQLSTSDGSPRILLVPELLNNLAASLVLEARRNPRGLGSLEEETLLAGGYVLPEQEKLAPDERDALIDAAIVTFLRHNVCFRETDPLTGKSYIVFPDLINLKKPTDGDPKSIIEGPMYVVTGAVENVYASLVVLLGYTQTFTRTNQWHNQARYEFGDGLICGFRAESEHEGELVLSLYFGGNVGKAIQTLFQGLLESFLSRRNLRVVRLMPVHCGSGHSLNRSVVREQRAKGAEVAFCPSCGEKLELKAAEEVIQLVTSEASEVSAQRNLAERRSRFEQVVFRLKAHVAEARLQAPTCFISYAWGVPEDERWVERFLASDLAKAGIPVILDRWESTRIGASVPRFVERAAKADRVIVVGTPLYREKYENRDPMRGTVVAAEGDLIGARLIGTEAQKETVLPVLRSGTDVSAFPDLLIGRIYADMRSASEYFASLFGILLSIYGIEPTTAIATDLRSMLVGDYAADPKQL